MFRQYGRLSSIVFLNTIFISIILLLNGCGSSHSKKKSTSGDSTAPSAITNLSASGETTSSVVLSWTSPGDDGNNGTASEYDIRYSNSNINETNWVNAVTVNGEPSPATGGTNQQFNITGLTCGTVYYFAVKTSDEVPNTSALSNIASGKTSDCPDSSAPSNTTVNNFINGGALYTLSSNVTLSISATDSDGVTAYYLSEDSIDPSPSAGGWIGITATPNYTDEVSFTLSSSDGTKDVYVWFKDASDNVSASKSDSIILDNSPPDIPSGIKVQVISKSQMDVTWTSPADGGDMTTYNIYRDGILIGVSDATSFSDKTVIPGKKYTYTVTANDSAGNESEKSLPYDGMANLFIGITSPANLITVASSPLTVSGEVNDASATVTVNGVAASVKDGKFEVHGITITEGMNTISAKAIDADNNIATASVNISLDSTPPHIAIISPPDGYRTTESTITVTGIINDIVRGTVNESQGNVLVNGLNAEVSNRNFIVESVPLQAGANTITAAGSDQWGNTKSSGITVTLDTSAKKVIKIVSGNNQSSLVGSTLSEPLLVSVLNNGNPVEGATVIFKITENNGSLTSGNSTGRSVATTTGSNGQSQAVLTLGTWAGSGNNKVEVSATGIESNVIFTESGLPKNPASIYVAQGGQQRGAVSQLLPEPLVAYITDEGHNPLENVSVIFKAVEGGGLFTNGLDSITVNSDSDGRATTSFILGPNAGNDSNVIEATFTGNTKSSATFNATGLIPGDPGATKITGVVLDNSNKPIPNVTMRVEGTTREAKTDTNGQFIINSVPVGPVHLIADGSTGGNPGILEYPTLMYELTTIAGADNTVGMPIYLVPIDLSNAKQVGGNEDVTYTIPDVPGFSFTVKANSVTFPDGRKQGYISLTQVHADKVPMVPQIGQQPNFIVTIQPPGTVFDPPAPITIPNIDGLSPGEKTSLYSFDHDLGVFVSIGTGTVSEDGTVINSDPGVGVVKAGWHSGGNPNPTGNACNCGDCQTCLGNSCIPDISRNGMCASQSSSGSNSMICQGGVARPVEITMVKALVNGRRYDVVTSQPGGTPVDFTATATGNNCNFRFNWDFGDGQRSTDQNPRHTYMQIGTYTVTLNVECDNCSPPGNSDTIDVMISGVAIEPEQQLIKDGDISQSMFTISVPPTYQITEWGWTCTAPQGAGNNPSCIITPPDGEPVVAEASWFALPDDSCLANQVSTYTVKSTVTIDGTQYETNPAYLNIGLPLTGGETKMPMLDGVVSIALDPLLNVWRVAGSGTLTRVIEPVDNSLSPNSQFYDKVSKHEEQHVADLIAGPGKNLVTVDEFYPTIAHMTAPSEAALMVDIQIAYEAYLIQEEEQAFILSECMEFNAYQVSDPIAPNYFYNNCGRFSNSCPP